MSPEDARPADFVVFAAGQGISAVGMWMQKTALGWLAWELTHSPAWVGALALTELLAAITIAPFAGAMTDRTNQFRLIWSTQALMLAIPLLLFGAHMSGFLTIWAVFAFALADSFVQAFNQPVRMTIIGNLAGPERLSQAVATNSIAFNMARATGPALAGLIMLKGGGTPSVFIADALAFSVMLGVLLHLRSRLDRARARAKTNILDDIVHGCRYIVRTPQVATIFLLALAFSLLARPFTELFPAIAGQVFDGGPEVLSALMSAQGIGALAGGWFMLKKRQASALARVTFNAGLLLCAALLAFSLTDKVWLAIALMSVAGLGHVVCNIGMQSLTQITTEPGLRGRVVALYGLIFRACPSLSAALIGLAAQWVGLQHLIGICAALCALIILALAAHSRPLFVAQAPAE